MNVYSNIDEINLQELGIPQGGALSGLMANIVLNNVDNAIKPLLSNDDLYIRYCDDMILLSNDKERCNHLFETYFESIANNKLVPHAPNDAIDYYWCPIISFESGQPEWNGYEFEYFKNYPSIQWKLLNLKKLAKQNPQKMKEEENNLKCILI